MEDFLLSTPVNAHLSLNQREIMDVKVLLLHLAKALLKAFLTPSNPCVIRPRATKPLQAGCYTFLGMHFMESLVQYFFLNMENAFTLCTWTLTRVSALKFYPH